MAIKVRSNGKSGQSHATNHRLRVLFAVVVVVSIVSSAILMQRGVLDPANTSVDGWSHTAPLFGSLFAATTNTTFSEAGIPPADQKHRSVQSFKGVASDPVSFRPSLKEATVPKSRSETILDSWNFEPKNLNFFWKRMGDRPFMRTFYPMLSRFGKVLDVGARGYNRLCKDLINSTDTLYYQVEPHPAKEMKNDGLLHCKVQEIPESYPQFESYFGTFCFRVMGFIAEIPETTTMCADTNALYPP